MSRAQIPLGEDDTEIEDVDLQLGLVNMACDFAAKTKIRGVAGQDALP